MSCIKYFFISLLFISTLAYADEHYTDELESIYKQQINLNNANLYIKGRIDKHLKFDAINNTNTRQRHIVRLIEKITKNNDRLEALDNRINYIHQMIILENIACLNKPEPAEGSVLAIHYAP